MILTDNKTKFLAQLDSEIKQHVKAADAKAVSQFAHQYYDTFPLYELKGSRVRDIYGSLYGSWHFLQSAPNASAKVRVFNPDYEKHGWQSAHTVIAVHVLDTAFVVDSLRMALNARNLTIHTLHSVVLPVKRNKKGDLSEVLSSAERGNSNNQAQTEALVHIAISRHTDEKVLAEIESDLSQVLADVSLVCNGFEPMLAQAQQALAQADEMFKTKRGEELAELKDFLHWFGDNHFTFLGFDQYDFKQTKGKWSAKRNNQTALGLLEGRDNDDSKAIAAELNSSDKEHLQHACVFSKSARRSRVHRDAHALYIHLRRFDDKGELIGEMRFLGLFTSAVYTNPVTQIPLIRKKLEQVFQLSGLDARNHDGKSLKRVLDVHPRDEIFLTETRELAQITIAINEIQERRQVRLFVRQEHDGKFVSCLVYAPRDIYRTELRADMQKILSEHLNALESEFTTYFSESILTRTHFVFQVDPTKPIKLNIENLESELVNACQTWPDRLRQALVDEFGEEQGTAQSFEYHYAFPPGYQHDFDPLLAVGDIKKSVGLCADKPLNLSFYKVMGDEAKTIRLRLFNHLEPLPLSDVIPVLEHMGLRVLSETPYNIEPREGDNTWVHDFVLHYNLDVDVDIASVKDKVQEAFIRIWGGEAESDNFNRLLLGTQLDWRQVALLRAYSKYMKQINFKVSSEYIAETLGRYLSITQGLVDLFEARFNPAAFKSDSKREKAMQDKEQKILHALEEVDNLNDDQVYRSYLELILATLRTNFYQQGEGDDLKAYFSFKIAPEKVQAMPLPKPMFEIFVYAPWVEGVHLRGGKVARGGLRWSDRLEDFRTEVLGLVKAQQVKNAVIVPVGAKGGFVAKQLPSDGSRDEIQAEGIYCYKTFIRGLLDITDNRVEGKVVPPQNVVRMDEDDPYLVVAADKGTATFSDIANGISEEYGHWLGDAFASGGSIGYDHKGMGITAKGAWVSVQRHFRELGINVQETDFSVVGVGDMAGDVFGNGMLLSEHICLVAAFNHMHIFVDPTPNSAKSFVERKRLFELPRSSWTDYNQKLISKGGGIFNRSAKYIDISPEMKKALAISADRLTPNELITAIISAPVDLFWNGGIGTYVKASDETHGDVGDKANDLLRINAKKLRCKVIGEGGNLGITQRARMEYGLKGGASNTDFIDNAAGVDCSDHEVNIKILLNEVVANGDLTEKQRRNLLAKMTDNVSSLVLDNNYRQTQAISIAQTDVNDRMSEFRRLIHGLEERGKLNRALEFIPDDETLAERKTAGKGLVRPELSVLISYVKGELKEELLATDIADDSYIAQAIETAFPTELIKRYKDQVYNHRLRREIISTQVANDMVNMMGITFVERMRQSAGNDLAAITRGYISARDVFSLHQTWADIEALDYQIDSKQQMAVMKNLMRLVRRATHWFVRNRRAMIAPADEVKTLQPAIDVVSSNLQQWLTGDACKQWQKNFKSFKNSGLNEELARRIAGSEFLYSALGIAEVAHLNKVDVETVGEVFFAIGAELKLDWFNQQIAQISVESHWQALAREAFRDDLEWQQRSITESVLKHVAKAKNLKQGIDNWTEQNAGMLVRWHNMVTELQQAESQDFAMFSVATRELFNLAQVSTHCN